MKYAIAETFGQKHLADESLFQLLEKVDGELAENIRRAGCVECRGVLHKANYKRKPRGSPNADKEVLRLSFCCDQRECRKRHTPPSVRFLGRKVYWGVVVILISAMNHGLRPEAVQILSQSLGIDRRTLQRWRQWWLVTFVQSSFWKSARARFSPLLCEKQLPLSLCRRFEILRRDRLLDLLKFLGPITCSKRLQERVM